MTGVVRSAVFHLTLVLPEVSFGRSKPNIRRFLQQQSNRELTTGIMLISNLQAALALLQIIRGLV